MKRVLRWAAYGLASLVTVVLCAVLGAFAASEVVLHRTYPKRPIAIAASHEPGAIERGRRLAVVNGCHDCHGADLAGKLFHDQPMIVRAWAPNLTLAAARQSDADLARAIRYGVAANGRSLWIMPSDAFSRLSDQETADLLAYIRSFPVKGEAQPGLQVGPMGRLGLLLGKFSSAPANIAREQGVAPVDLGPHYAQGRQLARACMECHGRDLKGGFGPDLTIAGAYDEADFEKLLRTGLAAGDRRVGLMSQIAPVRFNALSHEEIAALHAYLKARADKVS